jgi:hypothetical protein
MTLLCAGNEKDEYHEFAIKIESDIQKLNGRMIWRSDQIMKANTMKIDVSALQLPALDQLCWACQEGDCKPRASTSYDLLLHRQRRPRL